MNQVHPYSEKCSWHSPQTVRWGSITLAVIIIAAAFFGIGGCLASAHYLPHQLSWMNLGTVGNSLLLGLTGIAAVSLIVYRASVYYRSKEKSMREDKEKSTVEVLKLHSPSSTNTFAPRVIQQAAYEKEFIKMFPAEDFPFKEGQTIGKPEYQFSSKSEFSAKSISDVVELDSLLYSS